MTEDIKETIIEKENWTLPDIYSLSFKETKGGDAYSSAEDDWADPPVGPLS